MSRESRIDSLVGDQTRKLVEQGHFALPITIRICDFNENNVKMAITDLAALPLPLGLKCPSKLYGLDVVFVDADGKIFRAVVSEYDKKGTNYLSINGKRKAGRPIKAVCPHCNQPWRVKILEGDKSKDVTCKCGKTFTVDAPKPKAQKVRKPYVRPAYAAGMKNFVEHVYTMGTVCGNWIYRSKPFGRIVEVEVIGDSQRYSSSAGVNVQMHLVDRQAHGGFVTTSGVHADPDGRDVNIQVLRLPRKNDRETAAVALRLDPFVPEIAQLYEQDAEAGIAKLKDVLGMVGAEQAKSWWGAKP